MKEKIIKMFKSHPDWSDKMKSKGELAMNVYMNTPEGLVNKFRKQQPDQPSLLQGAYSAGYQEAVKDVSAPLSAKERKAFTYLGSLPPKDSSALLSAASYGEKKDPVFKGTTPVYAMQLADLHRSGVGSATELAKEQKKEVNWWLKR